MGVAWGVVKAALGSKLPGVVGSAVSVYDGPVVSGEAPLAALTVGFTPSLDSTVVGRFSQDQGPDGFRAIESGAVLCELSAITGDATVPDVFTIFDTIASWIQADQTLGGTLSTGSTCTASADVIQAQTTSGGVQRLIITITYWTRII